MSAKTERSGAQRLRNWLKNAKKVVVAGIGNPIRTDDFVGVRIVQDLKARVSKNVLLIECETVPESFIQEIVAFDPTHILLIDAALLELAPGHWKLFDPQRLTVSSAYSTHMLPLRVFCEYLSTATKARISLLLIQPKSTDFGEGLSPEIRVSAEEIRKVLQEVLSEIN